MSAGKETTTAQDWRPNEGCPERRRNVLLVIRGVTQLACRLGTLGNPSRNWMIRATHSSDETRFPSEKRQSVPTTARRFVRGSPLVAESCEFWPGPKTCSRPPVVCTDGEPQAEPSENANAQAVLKRSHSARAAKCDSKEEYHSLPPCVASRDAGNEVSAPPHPLCDLGLRPDEAKKVHEPYGTEARRGEKFQTGRAPFDSK